MGMFRGCSVHTAEMTGPYGYIHSRLAPAEFDGHEADTVTGAVMMARSKDAFWYIRAVSFWLCTGRPHLQSTSYHGQSDLSGGFNMLTADILGD